MAKAKVIVIDTKRAAFVELEINTAKPQWALYSDEELRPGAVRWGLTIEQERERIRLLQSSAKDWPEELKTFMRTVKTPDKPTSGIDIVQLGVVKWLKERPVAIVEPLDPLPAA